MDLTEFLRLVWPDGEHFFVVEAAEGQMKHHLMHRAEDAAKRIKWRDEDPETNLYYAMASFKQAEYEDSKGKRRRRTQENVDRLKCFWIDLDCKGKTGDYADQKEAILDIVRLCAETGLQKPTLVVNSGYGIHAYWVLDEAISGVEWTAVADRWRATLDAHNIRHDSSCTTDAARILRPVGTGNKKPGAAPRDVKLIGQVGAVTSLKTFSEALSGTIMPVSGPIRSFGDVDLSLNEQGMDVVEHRPSSIIEIVKECSLLRTIGKVGGNVSEPIWHRTLGVLKFTVEAEQAIHTFSKGHPGYDYYATVEKTAAWRADPTSCEEMHKVSASELPGHCQNCQHRGSIKGPLQLGYPKVMITEVARTVTATGFTESVVEVSALPPSMEGRFKWDAGKLWRNTVDKEASKGLSEPVFSWQVFCDMLFYPTGHFRDMEEKHQMIWTVREREGVYREFVLTGGSLGAGGQPLFRELGENGVTSKNGGKPDMEAYIAHWASEIKRNAAATETYMRFGWHGNSFLLGDTMYTPVGSEKVKVGADAAAMVKYFEPHGDIETWTKLVDEAYNHNGMEPYQFLIGSAFGSILVPFMNVAGGSITSAISYGTGQGKTTACKVGFGVYGCPDENTQVTLSRSSVTHKGIFAIAGILHNIPVIVDEMTNIDGKELSDIVYTWSQGQPRIRLMGSGELAPIGFGWSGTMMQSSNKPMTTIIASAKPGADAELARLVEFDCSGVKKLPKDKADKLFKSLKKQYGVAAQIYVPWVVQNIDEVKTLLERTQLAIDRKFGLTGENRYWSANYTVAIVGLMIAKRLKLINFDLQSTMLWCESQSKSMRGEISASTSSSEELFSMMLNDLAPGIVVTDIEGGRGAGGKDAYVIKEPNSKYTGRAILDTGLAYLMQPAVFEWCSKKQVDPKAMISAAHERGWVKSLVSEKRYPGKGTNFAMGQTRCFILDWALLENSSQTAPHLAEVVHLMNTGTSK